MSLPSDSLRKFASFGKKEGQQSPSQPSSKPKPNTGLGQKDSYEGTTKERPIPTQTHSTVDMSKGIVQTTCTTLENGTKLVQYSTPQEMPTLVKDAKKEVGGEKPRFHNGWVIGKKLAQISSDGTSIKYYDAVPEELAEEFAHLLEELEH